MAKWVKMVDPSGTTREVDPRDVNGATGQGWSVETPELAKVREYKTEQGSSVGEALKATGEHAAETLTFGGSDVLLSQIPGYNEQRRLRDETFPIAGGVGTVGASLVPMLGQASKLGTVGKAVRATGRPMVAVTEGSLALGKSVEGVLSGSAPGVARRLAAKTAGGLTAGATEGAAIGAGQALSESHIQDKRLTAELLFARIGEGAAVGGALGGALGGAGELFGIVGKGAKGALKFVPGVGEVVGGDAQALAHSKALAALGFQRSNMKQIIKKHGAGAIDEMGAEATRILELDKPGAFGRALRYDLAEGAERVAKVKGELNDRANELYRTIDNEGTRARPDTLVSRAETEILEPLRNSLSGSDETIVREIKRELKPLYQSLERADKFAGAARAVPEIETRLSELGAMAARGEYEGLSTAVRAMRSELEGVRELYGKMGLGESANRIRGLTRSLARVEGTDGKDIYLKMSKVRDSYNLLDDAVARATSEAANPGVSFSMLRDLAAKQYKKVRQFEFAMDHTKADTYRQYWGIIKDEIAKQAERTGVGAELNAVNQRLKRVIALDEVASQSASFAGNRSVSLTDTIAGAGGAGMGSVLGGGIGAALGGLASTTANRFIRSAAGDELLAVTAGRYASLRKAVDAADQASEAITRGIQDAVKVPARQRVTGIAARLASEFEGQRQLVVSRNMEQQRLLDELNSRMTEVHDVAPELAGEITAVGANGSAVLTADMPEPIGTGDIRDRSEAPNVPDSEKAAWLRKLGVVRNPTSVIGAMKKGSLTGEDIDTLSRSYPALYGKMKIALLKHIETNALKGNSPDYQQRALSSIFTGEPIDATYDPKMIRSFQQRYEQARNAKPPAPAPRRSMGRASGISRRRASSLEREIDTL